MDNKRGFKRLGLKKRSRVIKRHALRLEGVTVRHAHRFLVGRWDNIREVRLHIIIWIVGVGTLIALVGIQMTWFQKGYIEQAAVSGGTYAEAATGPIQTLNPLFATSPAELDAAHLLFSSLYMMDTTGHLKGDVATTMTNQGDKVFTVQIRKDARWQDGQPLTAADVAYTVDLMKSSAVRSAMMGSWQGVTAQALDKYSVQFTLPAAYAAFPQALTFSILPKHLLKAITPTSIRESSFSKTPVGSGPFSLRLLQVVNPATQEEIVHMDANADFYNGRPRLDHVQLHTYSNNANIAAALKTGSVTATAGVESDIAANLNTEKYDTTLRPIDDGVYAIFNTSQNALKDVKVRQALQMATDTTAIRKHLFGNPQPLSLPFIADQVEGAGQIAIPKLNVAGATSLLDRDGWVMKNGVRTKGDASLRLQVVTRKNVDFEEALQVLTSQWRKIGVQVDTRIFDTSNPTQNFNTDVLQQRNYDVLLDDLSIGGDPDVFAYWHSQGLLNFSNYVNSKSDDDLSSARTTSDPALRSIKYVAFAKQWLADAPAIGLYQPNLIYIHSKSTRTILPDQVIVSADNHYAGILNWTAEIGPVYKTP